MGQSKKQFDRYILVDLKVYLVEGDISPDKPLFISEWSTIRFPVSRHLKGFDLGKTIESTGGVIAGLLNNPDSDEALTAIGKLFNDVDYLNGLLDIGRGLTGKTWYGQIDATQGEYRLPDYYGEHRVMTYCSTPELSHIFDTEGNGAKVADINVYADILRQTTKTID
jgi:hypothetical protein